MEMPVDLVLMRHAESEVNAATRRSTKGDHSDFTPEFCARPDARFRLTDTGIEQAKIAGEWLRERLIPEIGHFDAHFTSGFDRGLETAGHLDLQGALWETNLHLHERDWGDLVGQPHCDSNTRFAHVFAYRKEDPLFKAMPGGESMEDVCLRVRMFNNELCKWHSGKRVFVVTHGETIQCFRVEIEALAPWQFCELYLGPCGKLPNCHVFQYSRRDPRTDIVGKHLEWMREATPTISSEPTSWRRIQHRLWSNEELLEVASHTKRLVHK